MYLFAFRLAIFSFVSIEVAKAECQPVNTPPKYQYPLDYGLHPSQSFDIIFLYAVVCDRYDAEHCFAISQSIFRGDFDYKCAGGITASTVFSSLTIGDTNAGPNDNFIAVNEWPGTQIDATMGDNMSPARINTPISGLNQMGSATSSDWMFSANAACFLTGRPASFAIKFSDVQGTLPIYGGKTGWFQIFKMNGNSYFATQIDQTYLEAEGHVLVNNKFTQVKGVAYTSRGWASINDRVPDNPYTWILIQLDNKVVMEATYTFDEKGDLFWANATLIRPYDIPYRKDGSTASSGNKNITTQWEHIEYVGADFEMEALTFWTSPYTQRPYPTSVRVQSPKYGLDIVITTLVKNNVQGFFPDPAKEFWNAPGKSAGTYLGEQVKGMGAIAVQPF